MNNNEKKYDYDTIPETEEVIIEDVTEELEENEEEYMNKHNSSENSNVEKEFKEEYLDEPQETESPSTDEIPINYIDDSVAADDIKTEQPPKKNIFKDMKTKYEESKVYIGYRERLIGYGLIFIVLFTLTIVFIQGTFNISASKLINYKEQSNLDYKVYLKENNFYDTDYLAKDKIYIASLIDKILIDFNYKFEIEEETAMDFNYDIVAKLTINDESTGNNYFEKEYVLSSGNKGSIESEKSYNINAQQEINYDYYNTLANSFKQQYGVDTASNLTVYLKVNKANKVEGTSQAINNSTMYVKIPLSEKSVDIELNYQDINNSNYIYQENNSIIDNILFGILAVIFLAATVMIAVRLIRLLSALNNRRTVYDKYVGRILDEYDRLIVENTTGPDLKNNNIIKINKFEELLDVRDNLKLPIMYYVISAHNKCYFYIKHENDLYLLTIKAIDLETEKNTKK